MVASAAFADDNEPAATLYKASKVYTMDGDPLSPGHVLVVDGKIKAVGESVDLGGASAETIDLGEGSVLMPGLVDAYSQTPLSSTGMDEITSEVTLEFKAIHSIDWEKNTLRRQLHAGTTTVNASPGTQNVIGGLAAIVKTMDHGETVLVEDGAMVAAMCSDPAARNFSRTRPDTIYVRQPTNRMGVVWILRNTFNKATRGTGSTDEQAYAMLKETTNAKRPLMIVSRMSYDIVTVGTLADEFGFEPIIVGGEEAYKVKDELAERKYPLVLKTTTREQPAALSVQNFAGTIQASSPKPVSRLRSVATTCWKKLALPDGSDSMQMLPWLRLLRRQRKSLAYRIESAKSQPATMRT